MLAKYVQTIIFESRFTQDPKNKQQTKCFPKRIILLDISSFLESQVTSQQGNPKQHFYKFNMNSL